MKKELPVFILVAIIVGCAGFFGGVKYAQSKLPAQGSGMGAFANLSPEERQARFQQGGGMGRNGGITQGARTGGNGFIGGEVLSKDDKSVTIKNMDGGSKIILFGASTTIMKASTGSIEDVQVGEQITANGSTNSDGTVTAQSIQIRPQINK